MDERQEFDPLVGRILDEKYRIERLIGHGGMGRVYFAHHVGTGRPVAVKVILEGLLANAEAVARFRREAQAAGSIRHPNVVDVTDFGVSRDEATPRTAYLVMEYLEGRTLRHLLEEEGPLHPATAVDVIEQIAVALGEAHRRSIVHRDLKPDNIWLVPDPRGGSIVKVLDFGVAALIGAELSHADAPAGVVAAETTSDDSVATTLRVDDGDSVTTLGRTDSTSTVMHDDGATALLSDADDTEESPDGSSGGKLTVMGSTVGTPAYMSPEQCAGAPVDARSDLYALALVAFEMITGRRPFSGGRAEVIRCHVSEKAPRVDALVPGVPKRVADAIERSLAKEPGARHPSSAAFAGAMRVAVEGASVTLRRALSLYSDRMTEFVPLLYRACRPLVPLLGFLLLTSVACSIWMAGVERGTGGPKMAIPLLIQIVVAVCATAVWMPIAMWSHSLFAFAANELRVRPLTALTYENIHARLMARIGVAPEAGFAARTWHLMKFYTSCERHAPPGTGDLSFIVAALEGLEPKAAGARCRVLAGAVEKTYASVRIAIIVTLLLVPIMETATLVFSIEAVHLTAPAMLPSLIAALIPINALWMMPVFSIALALVYFRSRQAQGEDVALGAVVTTRM